MIVGCARGCSTRAKGRKGQKGERDKREKGTKAQKGERDKREKGTTGRKGQKGEREKGGKERQGHKGERETGKGRGSVTPFGGLRTYNANLPADAAWQAGARRAPHPVSLI